MRTGAIFARGSCRALKWMALVGMVLALGVGAASAQVTVALDRDEVPEGDRFTINVEAMIDLPADADGTADITVTVTPAAGTATTDKAAAEEGDVRGGFTAIEITVDVPAAASGATATVHRTLTASHTVTLIRDPDAEVELLDLGVAVTANGNVDTDGDALELADGDDEFTVTITERDAQTYSWDPAAPKLKEGGTVDVKLMAKPAPSQLTPEVDLALVDAAGYTLSANTVTFSAEADTPTGAVGDTATITITAPKDDGNEVEDTIELRALKDGTVEDVTDPLSITVTDKTPTPAKNYVEAKSKTEIDAAVAAARGRVDDSDGKWMAGDDDIMIDLDDLFDLPDDPTMFTIIAEATQDEADVVMASANASSNSVTVMAVGSGDAMVTVTVSANMKPSSATTTGQDGRHSAWVTFGVTVDAPAPREPRALNTDAVIKEISISGAEKRRIGGEERLHNRRGRSHGGVHDGGVVRGPAPGPL